MSGETQCTCCGDVVELLSYSGNVGKRAFSLCKTLVLDAAERTWIYMIILKDDRYPIIITEKYAKSILENPEEGGALAYNWWFNRYR